jgi:outer membrane protein OmpA-like peptidoglycan-associated protein
LLSLFSCRPYMGPVNVGREHGDKKLPFFISHIPEKNQRMLRRGYIAKHHFFDKIICFKFACRNEARRNHNLHAISYKKFTKKIKKNAKKGEYDNLKKSDSVSMKKPPAKKPPVSKPPAALPIAVDTIAQVTEPAIFKTDSLIVLSEFSFETNSATLKSEHFPKLDSLVDFLLRYPTLVVKISGHTDNTGQEHHNMRLSSNRAKVVAEFIISGGVPLDCVTFEGFGSSKPIASNETTAGRRKNRRVEIVIHRP